MKTAKTKAAKIVVEPKREVGKAILELVDKMHEEKKISREVIFGAIESAI